MRQLDENLWVEDIPFRMVGADIGARATIVRLSDGSLWVYSPVTLSDALRQQLGPLGEVRFLVAPNRFHHLDLAQWTAAYPDALVFAAPGLKPPPGVRVEATLGDMTRTEWQNDLEQMLFHGSKLETEAIFFHRASRTLVLTDVVFHVPRARHPWTCLVLNIMGVAGKFRPSRLFRYSFRDRAAVRQSLGRILAWDFERVIMAHGTIVERGGKTLFKRAFRAHLVS